MANKAGKGSAYERQFCRDLSEWWTGGTRTDCFWRTAGSGGRATTRGKRGHDTAGGYGDIAATDHEGAPFLHFMTLELKRGYSKQTVQDILDKPMKAAQQPYEEWVEQARESCLLSGAFGWAVVFRRDRRESMILFHEGMWSQLRGVGAFNPSPLPLMQMQFTIKGVWRGVVMMQLKAFFECVTPEQIKQLARRL